MSKCPPAPFLKHQIRNLKQTYQRNVHLGPKCWKPSLRKKHIQIILWVFSLALVPYAYMEATGFMSSSATSHQGAIEMFRLHFGGGAFMLSIFIYVSVSHPEDTEQCYHTVILELCLATTKQQTSTRPIFAQHFALLWSRIEKDLTHQQLNTPLASPASR